jgi:GAF domain-containing protein
MTSGAASTIPGGQGSMSDPTSPSYRDSELSAAPLEALAHRTPLEDSLLALSWALSTETSIETLLDRLLREARRFTRADAGTILLVEGDQLKFAVVQNDSLAARFGPRELRRRFPAMPMPLSHPSIAAHVALTGATLNLDDAYANHLLGAVYNRAIDHSNDYQTRSLLVLPLLTPAGAVVGVMELINPSRPTARRWRARTPRWPRWRSTATSWTSPPSRTR